MNAKKIVAYTALIMVLLLLALTFLTRTHQPGQYADSLTLYCAAGIYDPVNATIDEYRQYYREKHGRDIRIDTEFAGSGTLLSRLQVERTGDLYLAGDQSFIDIAREAGLVEESLPLATMTPVLALSSATAGRIRSVDDALQGGLRIGIGVPDGTAVGKATRAALEKAGKWEPFRSEVEVTKPTVNDLANAVKIGALDAAIVWDVTARQFGLDFVVDDVLSGETAAVEIGILTSSQQPTAALRFARFLAAPEKGLRHFEKHHFKIVDGDRWKDRPEVNFFSGALNRRALEPIIARFEQREGVRVHTVYQGCGALNAQMGAIRDQNPDLGFPDAYLACDVYYLSPVGDWFQDERVVSSTRMVIVTGKDNPHGIRGIEDLARPGLRLVIGHPTHCTIGGLTVRLFKAKGLYDRIMPNVVEKQPSSGMMVAPVVTGAADASIAYYNDTLPEKDRLQVVEIESEYARAVQPFGIAATSRHRHLMMRLYRTIGQSREIYEELGFGWELGRHPDEFEIMAPAGARPPAIGR